MALMGALGLLVLACLSLGQTTEPAALGAPGPEGEACESRPDPVAMLQTHARRVTHTLNSTQITWEESHGDLSTEWAPDRSVGWVTGSTFKQKQFNVGGRGKQRMCAAGDLAEYTFQVYTDQGMVHQVGVATEKCCKWIETKGKKKRWRKTATWASQGPTDFAAAFSESPNSRMGNVVETVWDEGWQTWNGQGQTVEVIVKCKDKTFHVSSEKNPIGEYRWPWDWDAVYPFAGGPQIPHVLTLQAFTVKQPPTEAPGGSGTCPPAVDVVSLDADELGVPPRKDCNYGTASSMSEILRKSCADRCAIDEQILKAAEAGGITNPAAMVKGIFASLKENSDKVLAGIKVSDLKEGVDVATNVFDIVDESYATFVGGPQLQKEMKSMGLGAKDYPAFKTQVKNLMKHPVANRRKLMKIARSGALDTVGALLGPMGAALSIASIALDIHEGDNEEARMIDVMTAFAEQLSEQILAQSRQMVQKAKWDEQIRKVRGYVEVFVEEMDFTMAAVSALSLSPTEGAGMKQFALLTALQADLATTRHEWMIYRDSDVCDTKEDQNRCASECQRASSLIPHTVPILAALHLSILEQMTLAMISNSRVVYEIQRKLYHHAFEYYEYLARVQFPVVGKVSNIWYPPFYRNQQMPMWENRYHRERQIIPGCMGRCANCDENFMKDFNGESKYTAGNMEERSMMCHLQELVLQGVELGFISLSESVKGLLMEIKCREEDWDCYPKDCPEAPTSAASGNAQWRPDLGGQWKCPVELQAPEKCPVADLGGLIQSNVSKFTKQRRLAAASAPPAFEKPPEVPAPRNDVEKEFHAICGDGWACIHGNITKEQVVLFRTLARKIRQQHQLERNA